MIERAPIQVNQLVNHNPTLLIHAGKRMPLTPDGYVPLNTYALKYEIQKPTIINLGQGAVSLSFDEPFGFIRRNNGADDYTRSQLTDGLTLAPSDSRPDKWDAVLRTDMPLTEEDEFLFRSGLDRYTSDAKRKFDEKPLYRRLWAKIPRR